MSLLKKLLIVLLSFLLLITHTSSSPLAQLDPKLRSIIESDPELMAEVADMVRLGTFPSAYENGRLFNYQRLGK